MPSVWPTASCRRGSREIARLASRSFRRASANRADHVSILQDGRVVFNIAGNKYRVIAWIDYPYCAVYIRFVGTHEQYDSIDAQTI